ncbi:hypothetical protein JKF63_06384 [Porcisia hertigi]|uniref:CDP-diacylglycerol--glycerol-3-phosphate 3-phosphatidyltransferase n=1 Tax=Porcisia hertigi TaxID=2761500 RepID=A0A836LJU2_9TRYP|nr:hypothetical protein JKF63_06384 [Porcisia hertigi]
MLALLLYLLILAIAAGVTFGLFSEVSEGDVAPANALEFFNSASSTAVQETEVSLRASPEEAAEAKTGGDTCDAHQNHVALAAEVGVAHIQKLLMKQGVPARQQHMISFLARHCCVLPVESHTVRVLNHPAVFYEQLKAHVMAAQRSITLSALYIGDGPLSKAFVACLEERVRWAAAGGHAFSITILLDYNRMQNQKNLVTLKTLMELAQQTRCSTASLPGDAPSAGGTSRAPSTSGSSFTFSDDELDLEEGEALDDRSSGSAPAAAPTTGAAGSTGVKVRLFLYQNPSKWNRLFAPFGRAKEALGVQHTKLFVFDERHTILTGANLSDDYFATRMDRYMIVEDNTLVARWFTRLVRTTNRVSHRAVCRKAFSERFPSGSDTNADRLSSQSVTLDTTSKGFALGALRSLMRLMTGGVSRGVSLLWPTPEVSRPDGSPTLHRKSNLVILSNALGVDPSIDSEVFCARTNALLHDFAAWARRLCTAQNIDWNRYDSFLFPTVQMGRAGVYHDSVIVKQLLQLSTAEDHIFLTSPYLNMYAPFVEEMLHGTSYVDCITSSVQTNGWHGQRGMAGRIPLFYLQLERFFYYLMKAYSCLSRVHIREFSVKGLTFHAKGLWFVGRRCHSDVASSLVKGSKHKDQQRHNSHAGDATPSVVCTPESISTPYLVAYGSTNYGYRSVHKDLEAEAFLLTTNDTLRETLRQELLFFLQQSVPVTENQFVGTALGRFQPVISLIAHMAQDFL